MIKFKHFNENYSKIVMAYNSDKSLKNAEAYAKASVKSHTDPDDGIEIWKMPNGDHLVVHTMNGLRRDAVAKGKGKKVKTIYKGK